MPYKAHFGLKDHPFALTPDVEFFFPSREHSSIIASLEFALRRETGVIKVVGDVGTGKTLLCRLLINKLVNTDAVAYINAPRADAQSIVQAICEEFGVRTSGRGGNPYSALTRFLVDQHAKGRMAVVVVDEAQHLGKEGLEAVRLVSNLETEKRKLLQIVLFGQTELDELLRDPDLRQLNQRVVFSLTTKPLDMPEAVRYIQHRVQVSRIDGVAYDIFSPDALELIAKAGSGVPRVINILADKSLLVAFAEDAPVVQRKHVVEAIQDSEALVPGVARWKPRPALVAAVIALVLALGAGAGWVALRHRVPEPVVAAVSAPQPSAPPLQAKPDSSSLPVKPEAAALPAKPELTQAPPKSDAAPNPAKPGIAPAPAQAKIADTVQEDAPPSALPSAPVVQVQSASLPPPPKPAIAPAPPLESAPPAQPATPAHVPGNAVSLGADTAKVAPAVAGNAVVPAPVIAPSPTATQAADSRAPAKDQQPPSSSPVVASALNPAPAPVSSPSPAVASASPTEAATTKTASPEQPSAGPISGPVPAPPPKAAPPPAKASDQPKTPDQTLATGSSAPELFVHGQSLTPVTSGPPPAPPTGLEVIPSIPPAKPGPAPKPAPPSPARLAAAPAKTGATPPEEFNTPAAPASPEKAGPAPTEQTAKEGASPPGPAPKPAVASAPATTSAIPSPTSAERKAGAAPAPGVEEARHVPAIPPPPRKPRAPAKGAKLASAAGAKPKAVAPPREPSPAAAEQASNPPSAPAATPGTAPEPATNPAPPIPAGHPGVYPGADPDSKARTLGNPGAGP